MSTIPYVIHDRLSGKNFTQLEHILGNKEIEDIFTSKLMRYQALKELTNDAYKILIQWNTETGEWDTSEIRISYGMIPHSSAKDYTIILEKDDTVRLYIDEETAYRPLKVTPEQVRKIRSWIK